MDRLIRPDVQQLLLDAEDRRLVDAVVRLVEQREVQLPEFDRPTTTRRIGLRETKRADASGMKVSEINSEQTTEMQITAATAPMCGFSPPQIATSRSSSINRTSSRVESRSG